MTASRTTDAADVPAAWFCEPDDWRWVDRELVIQVQPDTDFWQRTHYGFRRDNGHLLGWRLAQDFSIELIAHAEPAAKYDQAGLMVRASPDCWLKASIEYEPHGHSRLGSVVTNAGWSDWATQDVPNTARSVAWRVRRCGGDFFVDWRPLGGTGWQQMRIARLAEAEAGAEVLVGAYACSPQGPGFMARFTEIRIDRV